MPWKAFMQPSALTNSDNQLANELFKFIKYNNLCDTQRNIYFLTRESLTEILWIKFTH